MIDCQGKAAIKSLIMYEFIVVFVTAGSSAEASGWRALSLKSA
jgi:hypothetical protein